MVAENLPAIGLFKIIFIVLGSALIAVPTYIALKILGGDKKFFYTFIIVLVSQIISLLIDAFIAPLLGIFTAILSFVAMIAIYKIGFGLSILRTVALVILAAVISVILVLILGAFGILGIIGISAFAR